MGAAEDIEGLLEIAVVRQRSPVTGKKRLVTGMSDRGLLEHRDRLGPLPRGAERLSVFQRRVGILGIGAKAIAIKFQSRRGSAARLASVLSPSDPVMSDMPSVWQPQSPNAKIADDAVEARSLAKRCWATAGACT